MEHINTGTRRHQIYMNHTNRMICVRAGILLVRSNRSTWLLQAFDVKV
ncbi:unnamed protein product [Schistosoma mattheei]|uniref:Uncharacterized protein n=1 Tax=Schistosoma mattheei TaxID=31246 RepID=A0A3P8JN37_9TREM|nr:unnamed protein product [Schistosoma mattheei]